MYQHVFEFQQLPTVHMVLNLTKELTTIAAGTIGL